jgi:hypothetical protein
LDGMGLSRFGGIFLLVGGEYALYGKIHIAVGG